MMISRFQLAYRRPCQIALLAVAVVLFGQPSFAQSPVSLTSGSVYASGFTTVLSVVVDSNGNVWTADPDAGELLENGSPVNPDDMLSAPAWLGADGSGNVYVWDYDNNAIYQISSGSSITELVNLADYYNDLQSWQFAVDSSGDVFFAGCDSDDDGYCPTIEEYVAGSGVQTFYTYSTDGGTVSGYVQTVGALAVDSSGNVYNAYNSSDLNNSCGVDEISSDGSSYTTVVDESLTCGNYTGAVGTGATATGVEVTPYSAFLDSSNNLYIVDYNGTLREVPASSADIYNVTKATGSTCPTSGSFDPQLCNFGFLTAGAPYSSGFLVANGEEDVFELN